jgi:HD-like signal output (HDOD) protein
MYLFSSTPSETLQTGTQTEIPIASIIQKIEHFKPVVDVAGKIMAVRDDPACGTSDLAEIIRCEPSLTANVLKLANSAYFGLPGKLADTRQAIIFLGMTQVVDLVLVAACAGHYGGAHNGYGLARGELWRGAVTGAVLAGDLARIKEIAPGAVFSGALMRDIGKIVLNPYLKPLRDQILNEAAREGLTFLEAERRLLGVDHAQVGALVAKKWHFPNSLQAILANHHHPCLATRCPVEATIVHVADALCRQLAIGVGIDDPSYLPDEQAARQLGLSDAALETVLDGLRQKMSRVDALFAAA